MFAKIILYASSSKLSAGLWRLGRLQAHQVFHNDEQGHRDFNRFLQGHSKTSLYLLADAVEEDYRLETLPHTAGNARSELVERKLSQIYRSNPFRAAHYINREPDKRKDDRFLFAALTNTDFMQGWLDSIEQQQSLLAGVYLLPMISQAIVRRMKLMAPHIVLSERLGYGLRQTYLHNGRLRISRLIPIPADAENTLGYFYVSETEKTRLYLNSQRFISRDTVCSIVLPLDENSEQICRAIEQEPGVQCQTVDMQKFARSLHLNPGLLKANPELLHMHLLAIGKLPDNLAPSSLIKNYHFGHLRKLIYSATALIVFGGLLLAGLAFKQSVDQAELTRQAALDTQTQERLYSEAAKNFPATPIASSELKTAVELDQAITSYAQSPQRMMQVLSLALDKSPEIQLNRMRWVLTADMNVRDDDNGSPSPAAAATPPSSSTGNVLHEVGFVNGEIKAFSGDYRAALASVNHLADLLKMDKNVEQVTIVQQPVNVSSYSNLQGTTTDEHTTQKPTALFKLKLTLKREVPQA